MVSQVYAAEAGCFVVAPCAVVSAEMVELLCDTLTKQHLLRAGGGHAMIFGPDGVPLNEPLVENVEGIVYADIDLGIIAYAKSAADPTGHYSRPDVARLLFDPNPSPCVERFGGDRRDRNLGAAFAAVKNEGQAHEPSVAEPSPAMILLGQDLRCIETCARVGGAARCLIAFLHEADASSNGTT